MFNKLRKPIGNDWEKQPKICSSLTCQDPSNKLNTSSKTFFPTFFAAKKQKGRKVTFSAAEPQVLSQSEKAKSLLKNSNDQGNQTEKHVKIIRSPARSDVIQKDFIANPRVQTTYQHHFNRTADLRLGYCDNRSIEERHRYFKNQSKLQDELFQSIKAKNVSNHRRYKNNCRQRISEYMAETSYVGEAIMKSGIHNHLKCPSKHCTHFITFK